jgi:hypothetical protein
LLQARLLGSSWAILYGGFLERLFSALSQRLRERGVEFPNKTMKRMIGGILILIALAVLVFRMSAHLGSSDGWILYFISLAAGIGGIRLMFK